MMEDRFWLVWDVVACFLAGVFLILALVAAWSVALHLLGVLNEATAISIIECVGRPGAWLAIVVAVGLRLSGRGVCKAEMREKRR